MLKQYTNSKVSHPTTVGTFRRSKAELPLLSFFTGAGFLDLGFQRAGFQTIWHNEYYREFVSGFESGMSSVGAKGAAAKIQSTESILDIGPKQIANDAFDNLGRPDFFGMIGGPPCPDFSVGGKNRGSEGENGLLTDVYANRILELNPSFFLLENVLGLIRTSKHRAFFIGVLEKLRSSYLIDLRVLNALEYGVPQDRERVFLVGLSKKWLRKNGYRKLPKQDSKSLVDYAIAQRAAVGLLGMKHKPWFPWDTAKKYDRPKIDYKWPSTSAFGGSPVRPEGIPTDLMVGPLVSDQAALSKLPNGKEAFNPYSDKFKLILEGDVSRKSFKRLHRWRYSPAAAYGNNEVHLHPFLARRLTVREAMRIQTVPDEYVLPSKMTLSAKFKTIGNGVPVKLAEGVGLAMNQVVSEIECGTFRLNT